MGRPTAPSSGVAGPAGGAAAPARRGATLRPVIYLDHAATTPLDPAAAEAMAPWLDGRPANPSAVHAAGRAARAAVEAAREQVAGALGVAPLDVLFTSGGTEADNAAVLGLARAAREAGRGAHIVTTAIEHHAVLDAARWLAEREGFALTVVPPEPDGVVDAERVLAAVRHDTVLASVMVANNELGTLQPIGAIGAGLAERGVPLHVDAVQAFGRAELALERWGVAAAALSAHKFGGPTGAGVLVLRRDVACLPTSLGGGQERGLRSGTLHTAGIVGCGAAAALAAQRMATDVERLAARRDRLAVRLLAIDGVTRNGHATARLPHNLHVAVDGVDGEALLLALDAAGVAVSTGSACQSGAAGPSHVLAAVGAPLDGVGHVRLTVGRTTTTGEVDAAATAFEGAVARLRAQGGGFW